MNQQTTLDDIVLLKYDYPELTFTVTFDKTTTLHVKGKPINHRHSKSPSSISKN